MTLSVWACGAADAARLVEVDVDGPVASPEPGPKFTADVDAAACCARKPTRALISYMKPKKRELGRERQ